MRWAGRGTEPVAVERFYAVIPAGGIGSRLWPLSRADAPKFLHDLTGSGQTLLKGTWERLAPIAGRERVMVVTGRAHRAAVEQQLPQLADRNVVLESEPKDSSAAIGLAAAILERREPGVIIGSFAADHVIADVRRFRRAVVEAIAVADAGYIATIGIVPTEPAIGFGYIEGGERLDVPGTSTALAVTRFVEKPDLETAKQYVESGRYVWNAGMFISRADVLLEEMAKTKPELVDGLRRLAEAWDTPERGRRGGPGVAPASRRSRSTTPSPSRRRPPGAWPSSRATSRGTTWATSPPSPRCRRTAGAATWRSWASTPACSRTRPAASSSRTATG